MTLDPNDAHARNVTDLVDTLLDQAVEAEATDLHLEPVDRGLLVRLRVDGQLLDRRVIPSSLADNVIARLKVLASLLTYRLDIPQEGGFRRPAPASAGGDQNADALPGDALDGNAQPDSAQARKTGPGATDKLGLSVPEALDVREGVANDAAGVVGSAVGSADRSTDGLGGCDFRVATFPTIRGERAVVRVFRDRAQLSRVDDLGFEPDQVALLKRAVEQPAGLLVVTGPAGSGKTTTLYALIRYLRDRQPSRSVIALEDPVEQRIDGVTQIQVDPHGRLTYERSLRSLLRQDPQVLLVGEVRDRSTAAIAVEATLTGHLILTTVHSGEPAGTIVRFLEMGIPAYQLVSTLSAVCSQRLVRKCCPRCESSTRASCQTCLGTGYHGRTAIAQTVRIDDTLRSCILTEPTTSQLRTLLAEQGPDLAARASALIDRGLTDRDEVDRVLGTLDA